MKPVVSSPERKRGCCMIARDEIDIVAEPLDLERVERGDLQVGRLVARLRPR